MDEAFVAAHKTRHLLAHVLVAAGARRWPGVALGDSGETRSGFFADFGLAAAPSDDELAALGEDMREILGGFQVFRHREFSTAEAHALVAAHPWKRHVLEVLAEGESRHRFYQLDELLDLCDCALKEPRELRSLAGRPFTLVGAVPSAWAHRGAITWFTRVRGEVFSPAAACSCCPP